MRRIAIVNLKGGTGKSTTATALAVALARRGSRTLLIDSDPSGNASWVILGGQGAAPPTLADVLARRASAEEASRATPTPRLDLLPADSSLGGVNVGLAQELGRDTRLRTMLEPIGGRYDFVIVDTGPQFTTLLANVLVYSSEVVVPVDPGVFAVLGLVQLQETIAEVREAYGNRDLHLAGLLLTKTSRSNVCRDVEAELRSRYGPMVFNSTIPLSAKVEEAHTRGTTVLDFAPKSAPALAYARFAEEIADGGAKERRGSKTVGGAGAVDVA